jgi:hypothetical protein
MTHHHPLDQRFEQIMQIPGVGRGFQHYLVGGTQVLLGPTLELGQTDFTGR